MSIKKLWVFLLINYLKYLYIVFIILQKNTFTYKCTGIMKSTIKYCQEILKQKSISVKVYKWINFNKQFLLSYIYNKVVGCSKLEIN